MTLKYSLRLFAVASHPHAWVEAQTRTTFPHEENKAVIISHLKVHKGGHLLKTHREKKAVNQID